MVDVYEIMSLMEHSSAMEASDPGRNSELNISSESGGALWIPFAVDHSTLDLLRSVMSEWDPDQQVPFVVACFPPDNLAPKEMVELEGVEKIYINLLHPYAFDLMQCMWGCPELDVEEFLRVERYRDERSTMVKTQQEGNQT